MIDEARLGKSWLNYLSKTARILQNVGCLVTAELWARNATKFTNNEDDEAMILFQQIRVQRNYSVLAERFPIEVGFTKESFKGKRTSPDTRAKTVSQALLILRPIQSSIRPIPSSNKPNRCWIL